MWTKNQNLFKSLNPLPTITNDTDKGKAASTLADYATTKKLLKNQQGYTVKKSQKKIQVSIRFDRTHHKLFVNEINNTKHGVRNS